MAAISNDVSPLTSKGLISKYFFWEQRAYYFELLCSNVDFRTIAQLCIPAQQKRLSKCNSISYSDHGLLGSDALWFSRPPRAGSGSSQQIFSGPLIRANQLKTLR